jgi:signal recognition particle subunit SRP54
VDRAEAEKLANKIKKGLDFDLEDFKSQLVQMKKSGGLGAMMDKLPAQLTRGLPANAAMDDRAINRIEGIINAMTPLERRRPELLKASRKRRIAAGSGVQVQEVNRLLNQFEQMQKMMKMMSKGGLAKMMRGMKGLMPGLH